MIKRMKSGEAKTVEAMRMPPGEARPHLVKEIKAALETWNAAGISTPRSVPGTRSSWKKPGMGSAGKTGCCRIEAGGEDPQRIRTPQPGSVPPYRAKQHVLLHPSH